VQARRYLSDVDALAKIGEEQDALDRQW
jgi:hypothetical protein